MISQRFSALFSQNWSIPPQNLHGIADLTTDSAPPSNSTPRASRTASRDDRNRSDERMIGGLCDLALRACKHKNGHNIFVNGPIRTNQVCIPSRPSTAVRSGRFPRAIEQDRSFRSSLISDQPAIFSTFQPESVNTATESSRNR